MKEKNPKLKTMSKKIKINGNGKYVKLKSGDDAMMVKFTIEHLLELLEKHPEIKREWTNSQGEEKTDVVFFIIPSNTMNGNFTHYVQIIPPIK